MGCAGSKLDDLPAVVLCRDRTQFLDEAIRHRYELADAHASYARSLRMVGGALYRFLDAGAHGTLSPDSPVLNLPTQRKGDPLPPPSLTHSPPPTISTSHHEHSHSHSHSHWGSHINFHQLDESGSEGDSPLHSGGSSPVHHHLHPDPDEAPSGSGGPTYVDLRYARNRPTAPSVAYEQRPQGSETVHHFNTGDPSSSSSPPPPPYSYYGYPYPAQNEGFYPYPYSGDYSNYGGMGGFFVSAAPPPAMASPPRPAPGPGSSPTVHTPPPPPSPPRASTWDFLNPFEFESYYPPYTSSRSSKELREEEGIPDLEEEEQEVVKEAYGDPKFVASTSTAAHGEYSSKAPAVAKAGRISSVEEDLHYKSRPVDAGGGAEDEVDVVEKNVVADEVQRPAEGRSAAASQVYRDMSDVAREIKVQFERASETASELMKMLEVGKLLYHQKHAMYHGDPLYHLLLIPLSLG